MLNDMSGLYADIAGEGAVLAARMAVEDFGGKVNGTPVEVVGADHQNKADVAASIARQWFDVDGVDMITDLNNSAVALAVNEIAREKNKVIVVSGRGDLGADRRQVLAQHGPLDLRHLRVGARGGEAHHPAGRRQLVLHHRRLRLRPRRRAAGHGRGGGQRRQGGGLGPAPDQHAGLLLLPAPGAGLEGEGDRAGQRRRRHDQRHQAGGRVRHPTRRPAARGAAAVHHRRARARAPGRAGPDLHRPPSTGT